MRRTGVALVAAAALLLGAAAVALLAARDGEILPAAPTRAAAPVADAAAPTEPPARAHAVDVAQHATPAAERASDAPRLSDEDVRRLFRSDIVCDTRKLEPEHIITAVALQQPWIVKDPTPVKWTMYVHSPKVDQYVSASIIEHQGNHMFEMEEKRIIYNTLRLLDPPPKRAIYVDIGANIGIHALFFAALKIETHAFEPMPNNHDLLRCSLAANPDLAKYMRLNNVGLSNKSTNTACMTADADNQGHAFVKDAASASCTVALRELDDYWMLALNSSRVFFLKIDIEGWEPHVFEGARRMLEREPPLFILSEFNPSFMRGLGMDPSAMLPMLKGMGYKLMRLGEEHELHDAELLMMSRDQIGRGWNVLMTHTASLQAYLDGTLVL